MPSSLSVALTALYLRGGPMRGRLSARGWPSVLAALRLADGSLASAPAVLRRQGLRAEALVLEDAALLDWAAARLEAGAALTAACASYPRRWLAVGGPAALWVRGPWPEGPYVAVVGSRALSAEEARYAREVAGEVVRLGYTLVSGGAQGADRLAAGGALAAGGEVLEILPVGLEEANGTPGATWVSVAPPHDGFSAALAMERNALIYGIAEAAVVVAARFREGGTWHGATGALRRRVTRVIVRPCNASCASAALQALGAAPLACPSGLAEALLSASPSLFSGTSGAYAALRAG